MKNKFWMILICVILTVIISMGALPCRLAAAAGPIKWRAQSAMVNSSFAYLYQDKPFVDMVNERSKGRLVIELFSPGAVVDALEQFSAIQKNAIQVAMGLSTYNVKQVPEADIEYGLPMTFTREDDLVDFYVNYKDGAFYKLIDEAYKEKGAHLLKSFGVQTWVLISRQPIKNLDDIKGKKIRAQGYYNDIVKVLGASPVTMSSSELFMGLQTGTIDATLSPDYTISTLKFWDAAKGMLKPPLGLSITNVYVSTKAYDSLPADLKKIVEDAAIESTQIYAKSIKTQISGILDSAVKEHGVQITTLPDADVSKVMRLAREPIMDKAVAISPRSAKLIGLLKEYLSNKK